MKTPESKIIKTLVVEDEPTIQALCRRVLTLEGFEVDIAVNGKDAIDLIERNKYDFFLFDLKLPVMNGMELYQWLLNKSPEMAASVIFLTGSVFSGDTAIFLNRTGRPYLSKPFTPDGFMDIVASTLKEIGI